MGNMARVRLVALSACLLFVSACIGRSSSGPQPPPPSEPADGPVVAELAIDGTTFRLHDERDGCVAVAVDHPGLQATVHRSCFEGQQVLGMTDACGWLIEGGRGATGACDVKLPEALYGRVTAPEIGYVCVGETDGTGGAESVTGARFISFDTEGFVLEPAAPGESPDAHLYTHDGIVYGEPPLDAPSGPIYELCERRAPWGEKGLEYEVLLEINIAEELRTDEVLILFDAGTGQMGVTGTASANGSTTLAVRVGQGDQSLRLTLQRDSEFLFAADYPWPVEVAAVLNSGEPCPGFTSVHIDIDSEQAQLAYQSDTCGR